MQPNTKIQQHYKLRTFRTHGSTKHIMEHSFFERHFASDLWLVNWSWTLWKKKNTSSYCKPATLPRCAWNLCMLLRLLLLFWLSRVFSTGTPLSTFANWLFHSFPLIAKKPTRKLAARTFIQSQYLKALAAASLRVGVCDEWKRGFRCALCCAVATTDVLVRLRFAHILVAFFVTLLSAARKVDQHLLSSPSK